MSRRHVAWRAAEPVEEYEPMTLLQALGHLIIVLGIFASGISWLIILALLAP